MQVLIPRDLIAKWLEPTSGLKGILIGSYTGIVVSGVPFIVLPVIVSIYRAGAGVGPIIAFLTGMLGLEPLLVWQIPFLGLEIPLARYIVCLFIPPLVGLAGGLIYQLLGVAWELNKLTIIILKKLWLNSSREMILAKLPGRTWKAIAHQAFNLGLLRVPELSNHTPRHRWKPNEEDKVKQLHEACTPITEIATSVGRSQTAILQRAWEKKWQRPHSDQRMAITKLSSTNQNPKVSKRITSGLLFGGQVSKKK